MRSKATVVDENAVSIIDTCRERRNEHRGGRRDVTQVTERGVTGVKPPDVQERGIPRDFHLRFALRTSGHETRSGRPFSPSTPIFGAPTDDTWPGGSPFRDIASASRTPVFGDWHPTSGHFGCPIRGFLHMSSRCIFLGPRETEEMCSAATLTSDHPPWLCASSKYSYLICSMYSAKHKQYGCWDRQR